MKILICGICGFTGSSLAKLWMEQESGLTIYGLDNFIRPGSELNRSQLQKLGVKLVHGDIRLASDIDVLPAVDWVIDAAASPSVLAGIDSYTSSRQLVEHNLIGTLNILEYCKRHGAGFVLLSSSRVYSIEPLAQLAVDVKDNAFRPVISHGRYPGLSLSGLREIFSTSHPISLYGSTKLSSEILALEYGSTYGFPVWINRCGVLAGAGQFGRSDQGIFSYWINAWLRNFPLAYNGFGGNGYQVRDCLHPRDLVRIIKMQTGSASSTHPQIFNVGGGTGNAMSLKQLSAWCGQRFTDRTVGMNHENRRFDVPWLVMDSTTAFEKFGWKPETGLIAILEEIALHAEQNPDWLRLSSVQDDV